ncbi:hypothetical protein SAMN04515620_11333 [Collimonas sp. OK607]|uniref:hypothetical protein n=1 Tax=Collimonas sp. OK607 TaxID=1798194 RepID=UPI0008EA9567|nr:hypothetical protein [Collimonas sp. OK607]SFB02602.1 hypothetical protein SAMN04515620_11333 [Collimonas sp. OK607]
MSHSTTLLDLLSSSQAQKEVTANSLLDAASPAMLFGRRAPTTAALTWGYYGGTVLVSGLPTQIGNGTVALTASATNYVEATSSGVVSANTAGFTVGRTALYTVITGAATVNSYTDQRTVGGGSIGTPAKRIAAPTWSATITLDWSSYDVYRITLSGATTFTFTGATDGQNCMLELLQDGAGSRLVTWPATTRFSADLPAPTLTTIASKMDRIGFQANAGLNKYDCVAVVKGY